MRWSTTKEKEVPLVESNDKFVRKFAWWPVKILTDSSITSDHYTVVWLEYYKERYSCKEVVVKRDGIKLRCLEWVHQSNHLI